MNRLEFEELELKVQQSDLPLKSYLQQVGVSYSTYHYWRKGISSLCGLVHEKMKREVRNSDVLIFIGSSRSSQAGKAITYAYTRWDGMMRCGNHEAAVNMSVICPCWLPASHMM